MNRTGPVRIGMVTGASSGIGLELCRRLARDGARVVMVARDEEKLTRAARFIAAENRGVAVSQFACDLARAGAAAALHVRVNREAEPVDFLVNNAGVGTSGRFAEADLAAEVDLLQLNIVSLVELTRLFLHDMLARRRGRILNVASTAAFLPGPLMSVYYASKAFVLSFSEALAEEVQGSGVTVTALCPGPTVTGFQGRAGAEGTRLVRGPLLMQAAPVAEAGYRGALEGKRIVIPGLANKAMVQALRVLPRAVVTGMVRRVNEPIAPADAGESGNGDIS